MITAAKWQAIRGLAAADCGRGALGVRIADSAEELRQIFRLRYRVYVQEYGRLASKANHVDLSLQDEHDESAIHLFVTSQGETIACVRLHLGGIPDGLATPLELERFSAYSLRELALVSKLMVRVDFRRSTAIARLGRTLYQMARATQIKAGFCTTFPELVPLYERIGMKSYKEMYADPDLGPHYAMVLLVEDCKHFERVGSFLRRDARDFEGQAQSGDTRLPCLR